MALESPTSWRGPHPIRWLRSHPAAADLILATLVTSLAVTFHLLDLETDDTEYVDPAWWTVPIVFGAMFPVAWRRSRPIASTLVVVAFEVTASVIGLDGTGFLGVVISLYSIGAHTSGVRRTRTIAVITAAILLLFVAGLAADEVGIGSFISSTIILVTAFVLGDNLRRRRDAAAAMQERAERAERERELVAEQQVAAERNRIARELHDVVAHSVSVMVIQAAAARRSLESAPESAAQALTNIEDTGRQTMNELRGILGVLRRSQPDAEGAVSARDPQPTLAELSSLLGIADDLPVSLTVNGDVSDLPASVTLTGYRVVQEALTNIRRHAGPVNRVVVTIDREPDIVRVTVADDGRGAAADDTGPGYGIVGMHERVAAVGGTIDAGWQPGGGWRVSATLPTESTGPRRSTAPPSQPPQRPPRTPRTDAASENVDTVTAVDITA